VNRESRCRGLLDADHVLGDALVSALVGWPHVGYHQIAPVHEGYPETMNDQSRRKEERQEAFPLGGGKITTIDCPRKNPEPAVSGTVNIALTR